MEKHMYDTVALSIFEKLQYNNLPVVIYGAGKIGQLIHEKLSDFDIGVDYYCDDDPQKKGARIKGIEIINLDDLKNTGQNFNFLISLRFINSYAVQLSQSGFDNIYGGGSLITNQDIETEKNEIEKERLRMCKVFHRGKNLHGKNSIQNIDLVITEKCSLKCKDCANLMQYYIKPQTMAEKSLKEDVNRLCEVFEEIGEVRIIGGEPFVNKDIHLITEMLTEKKGIQLVMIYTNGTIVPSDKQIPYFQNSKVTFRISDYGSLSKNLSRLTQKLTENNISYRVEHVDGWQDCARIGKQNRSVTENEFIFKTCCGKDLPTLLKGQIYICPFIANAENIKAIPQSQSDSVNIHDESISLSELRDKIWNLMYAKTYFEGCDWCLGRPIFEANNIPHALQTKNPIQYDIIS